MSFEIYPLTVSECILVYSATPSIHKAKKERKQQRRRRLQKRHIDLKSEFALPQTLLCFFHLV